MALTFYGLKNCDRCRAALKALRDAGIQIEFHDVRQDGVPVDTVRLALVEHGAERLINRQSKTWRGLDETARNDDPVNLLQLHPALMRRPLIVLPNGATTIGWDDGVRHMAGLA